MGKIQTRLWKGQGRGMELVVCWSLSLPRGRGHRSVGLRVELRLKSDLRLLMAAQVMMVMMVMMMMRMRMNSPLSMLVKVAMEDLINFPEQAVLYSQVNHPYREAFYLSYMVENALQGPSRASEWPSCLLRRSENHA